MSEAESIVGREIELGDREVRQAERERVCRDASYPEFAGDIAGKRTLQNAEHAKPCERPPELVRPVAARRPSCQPPPAVR